MKIDETHKRCYKCKETKTVAEFYPRKGRGLQNVQDDCKKCASKRTIEWRKLSLAGRTYSLWFTARKNAHKKEIEFTLTKEWIKKRLEKGVCEVSGVPFKVCLKTGNSGSKKAFGASLDRTDQTGGYTPENCKMVIWIYNLAKGTGTHADVLKLAKGVIEYAGT